jgi:hypothetical protein
MVYLNEKKQTPVLFKSFRLYKVPCYNCWLSIQTKDAQHATVFCWTKENILLVSFIIHGAGSQATLSYGWLVIGERYTLHCILPIHQTTTQLADSFLTPFKELHYCYNSGFDYDSVCLQCLGKLVLL